MGRELIVLGIAFLLAGLLAKAGRHIGLPTIPLFIGAGIVVGPNTPGPVLFDNPDQLELLSAFGLIFLLFYLGLEFSPPVAGEGRRRLLASAALYLLLNVGGGIALGFVIGWGGREALIIAGATGISSSAIVTKLLVELGRLDQPEANIVLGIIVVEDLFLALYLAALAPVLGDAQGVGESMFLFARAAGFLVALGLVARYGSHLVNRVIATHDDELLVVLFVGIVLLTAGAAHVLGASDAIGAFMAGLVLARTTVAERVERLVLPLRDAFGAVFFFAFGLSIDPGAVKRVIVPAGCAVIVTLLLALVAGIGVARINRFDRIAAAGLAFVVAARGEFALVLVALAATAGLDDRLGPFVAVYVLALALISPILASRSTTLAKLIPRRLVPDVLDQARVATP